MKASEMSKRADIPSSFQSQLQDTSQMASTLPALFNTLITRRAIIPAANGHCSARALARYYAALVDGGAVPPPHSSFTKPQLGSHPHIPKFSTLTATASKKQKKSSKNESLPEYTRVPTTDSGTSTSNRNEESRLFTNRKLHDAFIGIGEYEKLTLPGGQFGLGFKRSYSEDGKLIGFGHSGLGGSTGYCDINNRFAIAVTLNKMSFGGATAKVIQLVCSELNIQLPADFYRFTERLTGDGNTNISAIPLIN